MTFLGKQDGLVSGESYESLLIEERGPGRNELSLQRALLVREGLESAFWDSPCLHFLYLKTKCYYCKC
jgi:hypothetical protein